MSSESDTRCGITRLARGVSRSVALASVLALAGCSVHRVAVDTMVPVMEATLAEAYSTGDIETAAQAIPAQLYLMRGFCRTDSTRVELWTTTVQLYTSYAMSFVEPVDEKRAAEIYSEGYRTGRAFLMRQDWFRDAWRSGPDRLRTEISQRKPEDLAPLMMWTAACLGKQVLLHLEDPRILADLSYAYVLSEAAVDLAPRHFHGMTYALRAIMLAAVPLGLGGDLEGAKVYFEKAMEVAGDSFLFHHVLFALYYAVAAQDEPLFTRTLEWVVAQPADRVPDALLMNKIAQKRARELLARRTELF
jgi:hypothetical protein